MTLAPSSPHFGPDYTPAIARVVASCTAAIAALNARISVSSVSLAWYRRARWTGYANALKLQSAEIDEIDVFSWGCGLQLATRPRFPTNEDHFDRFADWEARLALSDPLAWRDGLPTSIAEPSGGGEHPPLIRALEQVRRHAGVDRTALPWLGLAFALQDLGLATTPLPCLTGGAKSFRLKRRLAPSDWMTTIAALENSASAGLSRLDALESLHKEALRVTGQEYRPGHLPALLALSLHRPLLSPKSVSDLLGLTVAGASKLLERAVDGGLLIEISARRSWRQFLSPDLALEFGFIKPKLGRPRKEPPPLPNLLDLSRTFDAFDREMEAIDALLARG